MEITNNYGPYNSILIDKPIPKELSGWNNDDFSNDSIPFQINKNEIWWSIFVKHVSCWGMFFIIRIGEEYCEVLGFFRRSDGAVAFKLWI